MKNLNNNKVFYLSTCDTCKRIMKEVQLPDTFERQDIKQENISAEDLDYAAKKAEGYEHLFSKRARKFRTLGLHEQVLKQEDLRKHILEEYTFLKRPVFFIDGKVYAGNSKKTVAAVKNDIASLNH